MKKQKYRYYLICAMVFASVALTGCQEFFDVEMDRTKINSETVFNDNANATSAMMGVYRSMASGPLLGGGSSGISLLSGLSSDELSNLLRTQEYIEFEDNILQGDGALILGLWKDGYRIIYQVNDILEGLEASTGVDQNFKKQIKGEALLIRALTYFYLVNIFGDIPIVLTTKYRENATISRMSTSLVYDQMLSDLVAARGILSEAYPTVERVRANKFAASALLARIYLYKKDWTNASTYASEVITANDYYELNEDVLSVFRKNSRETIWEIASDDEANTNEGDAFIIEDGFSSASVQIKAELLEAFEDQDARQNWIGTYTDPGTGTGIYFPYKYRERYYNSPAENFVILRLGEQYLIRAEAEAALGNKQESLADLDSIRARAAVPALSPSQGSISDQDLQDLIMHERRVELFAEWGHRWFDLKRWDLANSVLSVKTGWTEDDMLYPVPASEFKANPKLGQQNDGY